MRGIVRNADESREAEIAGSANLDTSPWPISVFALVCLAVIGAGFVVISVFLRFCRICLGILLFVL